MKALLLCSVLAASAMGARQDATYDLVWHPRSGDVMTFKIQLAIDSTPEKYIFTATTKNKVVKVKPNGDYDIETTTTDQKVKHGTHEDPGDDDTKPTTDTYNSKGEKIASSEDNDPAEEGNPATDALDSVTDGLKPQAPVKIGEKWTALIEPSAKLKREAGKVEYTLVGIDKQGAYQVLKIAYNYHQTEKDTPVTVDGFIMLSQQDFSIVRVEANIKGGKFSPDPDFPAGDATFSLIRD